MNTPGVNYENSIEGRAAAVRALWVKACESDAIDPSSNFVVFSDTNPHAKAYNEAMGKLLDARRTAARR